MILYQEKIAAPPVEVPEEEEQTQKKHSYLLEAEEYINSLSTHKCSCCGKIYIYGEWEGTFSKNGNGKKPYFKSISPSRKGIEHAPHKMLEGTDRPENYFERWDADVLDLQKYIQQGKTVEEIAKLMGRTANAINTAIYTHGLRENYVKAQEKA